MSHFQLSCEKHETLDQFLTAWDVEYKDQAEKIELFKPDLTSKWNESQQKRFVQLLYHQRAHFDDVLWFMGNFSPDTDTKEMIIENTRDEFGRGGRSHEKLYLDFAKSIGVDLTYELLDEEYYLPFLREYNHGHLRWFRDHDWHHQLTAFAAIERLDNVDYRSLKSVVSSFGLETIDLLFFDVHIHVKHFDRIDNGEFHGLWDSKPKVIEEVFNFIGNYQLDMWKQISEAILTSYP